MGELADNDLAICLRVLQQVADNPELARDQERLKGLVAKVHRAGRKAERHQARQRRNAEDRSKRAAVAQVRSKEIALPPSSPQAEVFGHLHRPRPCYICKRPYTQLHAVYHLLCPQCATLNLARRQQRADLSGRTALVTGGRVKIGYQTALRLLRDGAKVIVTTRFPRDAALRYANEPDFAAWCDRLAIYGLDLRVIPAVEAFAHHLAATEPALDVLVNNAAQTIKRPREFYAEQLALEQAPLPPQLQALAPLLPHHPPWQHGPFDGAALLPDAASPRVYDEDGQPLDLRPINSWLLRLHEVETVELLEVQLVNAVAPFILAARLKPLLLRSPFARRFVVNVSAMEGQFARADKTVFHPHTNMAKAALNMLTRTSAADFARDGIFMNSVDTGWITDENPHPRRVRSQEERGFYTPLDVIDGAARVYDPVARGVNELDEPLFGQFLKDYAPHPW